MHGKALKLPGLIDGLDLSRVQSITNAAAIKEAGFEFAFCKASEGVTYCDPKFVELSRKLDDAGVLVGTYGFARVELGRGREQARRAIECAGDTHRVRVMLDLESSPKGFKWALIEQYALEWLDEVRANGALPGIYTYEGFGLGIETVFKNLAAAGLLDGVPLWIAKYRSTTTPWAPGLQSLSWPRCPQPWAPDGWRIWQYSGDGGYDVPGIPVDCDRNLFRGTLDDLREFFGMPPVDAVDERFGAHGMFGVSPYDV